jgi:hypothetical protein
MVTGAGSSEAAGAGLLAGDVDFPPGYAVVRRFGPRLGLAAARQARAVGLIERRGWPRVKVS